MAERPLRRRIGATAVSEGAGVTVRRSLGLPALRYLDRFLMLDHFSSDDPDDYFEGLLSDQAIELPTHNLGVLGSGDRSWASAPQGPARFILVAGRPINEPVVQ